MSEIWVDADALPKVIRDILFKAAVRTDTRLTLVANQAIATPASKLIRSIQVQQGFDVADNEIAQQVKAGDLVVTQDIPLAADVVAKGALALNPRGEKYTKENIRARLSMRDFMENLRSTGVQTGGPPPINNQDRQQFANQLDRWLAKKNQPK